MSQLIHPGNQLVVDESVYAFEGACPVKRHIPRKPHPNGLETFGLAGYIAVGASFLPFVLDIEPVAVGNELAPQEALMLLHSRLRDRFPSLRPSLAVDSAFGSFARLVEINQAGGDATMSMSPVVKPWLWEMLSYGCGLDEGRVALVRGQDIYVGCYSVLTASGERHLIKIISSACKAERLEEEESEEVEVADVTDRRERRNILEYLTHFSDGTESWLTSNEFIDQDGKVNLTWLNVVSEDDLSTALSSYTQAQLKVLPHQTYIHDLSRYMEIIIFINHML